MTNFIVIFICLLAGLFCKRLRNFPSNSALALNSFIIYLSLPSLVLSQVPKLLVTMDFHGMWWLPVSMAWITFVLSFVFFMFLGKKLNWSNAKMGALILTAGLGNTSFVGFPILEALIGHQAIPIGILADQPGSFLVLSTLGIVIAAMFSGAKVTPVFIAKRVFTFPPFIALVLSVLWAAGGLRGHDLFSASFEKIASTLVPLALFSVGFQLKVNLKILKKRWVPLLAGLTFKLFFVPAVFAYFSIKILGGSDLSTQVTVLEAAMATMITSAVVATEFNLDSEIANLMVGIGIPLSLITVPLWNYFLFLK
ncbi:MAG: AEC family transporter [Bacteriovorax sp.]